jgi:Zn-dependent membrane protease YugP
VTWFPIGTFMRLLSGARRGSVKAQICLVLFLVGLFLGFVGTYNGSGVVLLAGVVLFVLSVLGSGPVRPQL